MASGLEELYRDVKEILDSSEPFQPAPYYSPQGDTLFLYARDVPSYAKRLNPALTLILSSEDDSLVGCKIKGVKRILACAERLGKSLGIAFIDGKIKLGIFIEFALATPPEQSDLASYEPALYEKFSDYEVDSSELQAAA